MTKESIQQELLKDNPDWMLISNSAKGIYLKEQQTNSLGLKKGVVNIIKASEYNCNTIYNELKKCFNSSEYHYLEVGSYTGITVTNFNRLIPKLNFIDNYLVILTNKDQVFTNLSKLNIQCVVYNASLRNKHDRTKETIFSIKGGDVDIKCPLSEIQAHIRDNTLNILLG
jgi:hypothetical protein